MNPVSVAAAVGRRIDAPGATPSRFPALMVDSVRAELVRRFRAEGVGHLVCAAACGADIVAIEAAREIAIPTTIVLPFSADEFRAASVVDRGGDWGERYDHLLGTMAGEDRLISLGLRPDDPTAYATANQRIVAQARGMASARHLAFVIWDGRSRGAGDYSAAFAGLAEAAGFELRTVSTLPT